MHISSAIFNCSAPNLAGCPDETLPEFAFIGRSNVGKSSLLNLLAGKEALARVSATPGFTRMLNFFTINRNWRLVDLPGYGFAQGARKDSARFNRAVSNYLRHRPNLSLVFALIDSGLSPQEIDLEFVEWLTAHKLPFVLVFTKTDRASAETVQANIEAFMKRIAAWFEKPPATFTCSAQKGEGRQELLAVIDEIVGAIEAESGTVAPEEETPVLSANERARQNRKRRPDLNRPW